MEKDLHHAESSRVALQELVRGEEAAGFKFREDPQCLQAARDELDSGRQAGGRAMTASAKKLQPTITYRLEQEELLRLEEAAL